MFIIDTHTHLYLDAFADDRSEIVKNAISADVKYLLLPNIDSSSIEGMLSLCEEFKGHCFPMLGLHPSSVDSNFEIELNNITNLIDESNSYIAIGEIGIDLYWGKTYRSEQEYVFREQILLALEYNLPFVVHNRESFYEAIRVLNEINKEKYSGVFHCFSGDTHQAEQVIEMGFHIGIGGVLTYKNSGLEEVVQNISLNHIVLETDSPFLPPVPYRGKRNESSYLWKVAEKIAAIKQVNIRKVADITSQNAIELFKLPKQH